MSLLRSRTWWSQRSLTQAVQSSGIIFSESCIMVRKESILPDEKHTFFPGNEISGSRISESSNCILQSDSCIKICIDFILLSVCLLLAIMIPYSISFFFDFPKAFYYTVSLFFLLDFLLSFNTSYFHKGRIVNNRKKIVKNYVNTWMVIDMICCFPCEIFIKLDYDFNSPKAFCFFEDFPRLFLLLKILKLFKFRLFLNYISELSTDSSFFTCIRIGISFVIIVIPIHWMCCISNMLYSIELDSTYIYWSNVKYTNVDRYLILFERIVQTVTSVGYGDFFVRTTNEMTVSIIFMLCTSGYFGFFIGHIEQIVSESYRVTSYFRRAKARFKKLYNQHKFNKKLKHKINAYIRHLIDTYKNHSLQDEDFIKFLSIPLREQVFLCTKGYVLIAVPFFKNLSRPCVRSIGYKMILRLYGPDDIIFTEGEVVPELFFINSGTIQIFHSKSQTIFIELSKNCIFGELTFLLIEGRTASARSSSFSEVLSLNRYEVDKIILKIPKDSEKLFSVVWNLKKYGIGSIGMRCYLCGSVEHIARNCSSFIWKANPVRKRYQDFDKRVNTEYTPRRARDLNELHNRYKIHNVTGKGVAPDKMYKENLYLLKKSEELARQLDFNRKNTRIISLIEMEERSNCESSNESEKNFLKFNCLESGTGRNFGRVNSVIKTENISNPLPSNRERRFSFKL